MEDNIMSDEQLVLLYQNGDNTALVDLVSKYIGKIDYKLKCYTLLKDDADDAKQEALVSLLSAVRTYSSDKGASFSTYADRCFDNAIKNHLIRLSAKKFLILKNAVPIADINEVNLVDSVHNNPEEIYINKEKYYRLISKIESSLSSFERSVLLSYLNGESYSQIASTFGTTPKVIDNALQRVRRKLKS